MPTLYIPIGVPGCGKSTWATNSFLVDPVIVSSDAIRKEIFESLVAANDPAVAQDANAKVFDIFHKRIRIHLDQGYDVIADATNLDSRSRRTLHAIAVNVGNVKIQYVFFDNAAVAVQQNRRRDEDAVVPDHVMDKMVAKLIVAREVIRGEDYDGLETIF